MDLIETLLEQQPLMALFLTIAVGYFIGEMRVAGFSLGVGAVLFVALAMGWLIPKAVPTPMGMAEGHRLRSKIGLVPILRAGLGMVAGALEMIPTAEVWHIGLYRDERTLRPVEYYNKLPTEPRVQLCLVLDPMLATGGSAVATVDILKQWGSERITYIGLLAAPEGVARLSAAHPDVDVHVASVDERLNEI